MKRFNNTKILLAIMLSFWATGHVVFGQTNTFPSTGNAGIGTTSPGGYLHIKGNQPADFVRMENSTTSDYFAWRITSNGYLTLDVLDFAQTLHYYPIYFDPDTLGNNLLYLRKSRVGIGTANPQGKLDVSGQFYTGQGNSIILRAQNSTNEGGQIRFEGADTNRYFYLDNVAGNFRFISQNASGESEKIRILNNGSVGIGTANPNSNYKLSVNGKIRAKEVVVETNWSDFVFADDYKLLPLDELEKRIKQNRHLPGIPSEKEVAESGVSLGDMQARLLQKIEELTLYVIDLKKENARLHERVDMLEKKQQ